METEFLDAVITLINGSRSSFNLDSLVELESGKNNEGLCCQAVTVEKQVDPDSTQEQAVHGLVSEIGDILIGENLTDEYATKRDILLSRAATHMSVSFSFDGQLSAATINIYFKYLEMEPIGPVIDGALVVQGISCLSQFGPSVCKVEYAVGLEEHEEDFSEVLTVAPWEMIITPPGDSFSNATFQIPINIGPGFKEGSCRVSVYVDEVGKIPYDEEKMEYVQDTSSMVCRALVFLTPVVGAPADGDDGAADAAAAAAAVPSQSSDATGALGESLSSMKLDGEAGAASTADRRSSIGSRASAEGGRRSSTSRRRSSLGGGRRRSRGSVSMPPAYVVSSIKIAQDYDDVAQYRAEGYDMQCVRFGESGLEDDQDQMWKFHLMFKLGPYAEGGIEDIMWVKCLKALGTLPELPGYDVLHEVDLSDPEDENSVHIAYKLGPHAVSRISMYATSGALGQLALNYVESTPGVFMRAAPEEIEKLHQGACGLFLYIPKKEETVSATLPEDAAGESASPMLDASGDFAAGVIAAAENADAAAAAEQATGRSSSRRREKSRGGDEGGDDAASADGENGDAGEDDDAFSRVTSDLGSDDYLESRSEEEIIESLEQRIIAMEAEKVQLLAINADLQKKAVNLLAREKLVQGQGQVHKSASTDAAAGGGDSHIIDHAAEKERQLQETLQQIVESRVKLERQQTEFDQLALDLQTRLDDKEFKAGEIAESFHAFKKEILAKAENSRTGMPISKKLVKQFELAEQKREEDLEKVRLRNISLRTTLRKMERTLRAREQLAEGLHMIDFEQLKIENQTLNEKIEERNEELAKLKRKKTVTVQVLTHIREKLQFVNKTNDRSRKELDAVEMEILGIRGELNAVKKDRDQVRDDNKELKRKQGFATNDLLLFDYEKRKASIDRAKDQIIDLQERYRVLSKQVMDYSHKISRGQMLLSAPSTSASSPFTASGIRK